MRKMRMKALWVVASIVTLLIAGIVCYYCYSDRASSKDYISPDDKGCEIFYSQVIPKSLTYNRNSEYIKGIFLIEKYILKYKPKDIAPYLVLISYKYRNKNYMEAAVLGEELIQSMSLQSLNQLPWNYEVIDTSISNLLFSIEAYNKLKMPIQAKILKQKLINVALRRGWGKDFIEKLNERQKNIKQYGDIFNPNKDSMFEN